ncbi:MAG TPA: neutral zinc metallopeptidase [Rhizomicrobium sp.]|jgi:hypothetical protein|nr:neutral zinc metallopeptidase [Rhizomicrobium sp.]
MRTNDLRPTSNVEDRRGGGGGFALGGIGLIIVVVVALYMGVDPAKLLDQIQNAIPPTQTAQQPQTAANANDPDYQFARKIVGSAEDVWTPILKARGVAFQPATLTVYDQMTPTACGFGASAMGPFYCPDDAHIYLDLRFFHELSDRFGAPGQFAQAYVIAHEFGHHIQALTGTMAKVQGEMANADEAERNRLSVRLELQADCYAGVWANRANAQFRILQDGDVRDGLRAASAVGDDTIEKKTQGEVVPDSFTHGTSAERVRWFRRGLAGGDMDQCDTFGAASL